MTTSKQYDNLDRLTWMAAAPASVAPWSFAYNYNDAVQGGDSGLYQRLRCTWPDGSYWLHSYDTIGQVAGGKRYWNDNTLARPVRYELRICPSQQGRPSSLRGFDGRSAEAVCSTRSWASGVNQKPETLRFDLL